MTNPFMVTSNECYGMSLPEASKRAALASPENENGREMASDSFLYSRESDRFGEGSSFSDSALSKVFRLKESDSMNKRRKYSAFVRQPGNASSAPSPSKTVPKDEVTEILSHYNHNPAKQNPLFGTTANEYGLKKPTSSTYPSVRHGLSQQFSQSFNRTMYRDEGLNAAITKSTVHDSLTPQFV
ncbi:hypothetical protein ACHAXT_004138 [Thalassiosira profunda]